MGRTERFQEQHAGLVKVVKEIAAQLDENKLATDAQGVRKLLIDLGARLKLHLVTEDQTLYPEMINHKDPKIKAMATRFQNEMGTIRVAFEDYMKRWATASAIQANAAGFVKETKAVFDVLAKRIEKENNELYPMVDKAA